MLVGVFVCDRGWSRDWNGWMGGYWSMGKRVMLFGFGRYEYKGS